MEINKEKRKEAEEHETLIGFVPFRLVVENRPELNFFPQNILFAKCKVENNKAIIGHALYEPDIASFEVSDKTISMTYHNKYGGNSFVIISFYGDENTFHYRGKKFVDDKSAGGASGRISSLKDNAGWQNFFTHLTFLGLSNEERCSFEDEPKSKK